ncbi:LamG domain-containing protein [Thermomonospora cellulosilytica]|uniref:LamG-like jellyroll fold domain-containing protein n=1 Tax=Thermomonospora cellulosilytica TaxID=1411118 RepID=A0A7W3MVM8_9ACTN|nr:LamG domain-containing protein [Thermomonospora cellulosilytica]MBA9002692.1 hypothetical protein [Thermomonospora cellulosilytica]
MRLLRFGAPFTASVLVVGLAGVDSAAADTRPVPVVYSADYPADDTWHDGVGDVGTFRISDSAGVAVRYELWLNGRRVTSVPTTNGEPRDVRLTPMRSGPNMLTVQAFTAEGWNGTPVTYQFRVRAGADPAARFALNENAGSASVAGAGRGAPAQVRGEATLGQAGRIGSALTLAGGHAESPLPVVRTDQSFTVSAWVRPTRAGTYDVLAQDGVHQSAFRLGTDAEGRPAFGLLAADTETGGTWRGAIGGTPLALNEWSLLTGVHDRTARRLRLYVNGTPAATTDQVTIWQATGAFQIGRGKTNGTYGNAWPGGIDDVRVYPRALLDADVRDLAAGDPPAGPSAHWTLDEQPGAGRVHSPVVPVTAALSGGATLGVPGRDGTALSLDGRSGQATANGPVIDTSRSFAVTAWVKPATDTTRPEAVLSVDGDRNSGFYLGRRPSDTGSRWTFGMTGSDSDAAAQVEVSVSDPAPVRPQVGEWAHLAAVHDATTGRLSLYVNGELTGEVAHQNAWRALGPLVIGRAKWSGARGGHFTGDVDDVRVYDRVLALEEIAELNAEDPMVRARWKLNTDGTGEPSGAPALNLHGGAAIDPNAGFATVSPAGLLLNGATAYAAMDAPPVNTGRSFTITGWARTTSRPQSPATVFSLPGANADVLTVQYVPDPNDPEWSGFWQVQMRTADRPDAPVKTIRHSNFFDWQWHHLAVVFDARRDRLSLYVDGALEDTSLNRSWTDGIQAFTATGGLQVGRDSFGGPSGSAFWPDAIDDIWVYEGALTEQQIGALAVPNELETENGP